MLFNLVKKDLILTRKYLIIMFIFAIGAPIFIQSKINFINDGGFLSFFITTLFALYHYSVILKNARHNESFVLNW